MSPDSIRLTTTTMRVLDVLAGAKPGEDMFGLRICQIADLGSGTVYPILDRLERAGWISGQWEAVQPAGRPKRRAYCLTGDGVAAYQRAVLARTTRQSRRIPGAIVRAGGTR